MKYGDRVIIKGYPFFENEVGTLVDIDRLAELYRVQLRHSLNWFQAINVEIFQPKDEGLVRGNFGK